MSTTRYRIVSGDDSEVYDEPHVQGRRLTVAFVQAQVEERGLDPQTVADRYDLAVAQVYEALAYYHGHPEEMAEAERERQETIADHEGEDLLGPEDA
ncbi:DUF433 domain-containing protein [Halobacteriales archaeon QS_1_68_20]|nr:MAG: DUF433 domain-containing protein [Halobacteriales archaeon QS_1_68_20]